MSDKLLPCPFCGASGCTMRFLDEPGLWVGECVACEVEGPTDHDEEKALAAWNRRAEQPDQPHKETEMPETKLKLSWARKVIDVKESDVCFYNGHFLVCMEVGHHQDQNQFYDMEKNAVVKLKKHDWVMVVPDGELRVVIGDADITQGD